MKGDDQLSTDESYEIIPFFHLEQGDILDMPLGIGEVTFDKASVPFGTGGNMVLGQTRWVSNPVKTYYSSSSVRRV